MAKKRIPEPLFLFEFRKRRVSKIKEISFEGNKTNTFDKKINASIKKNKGKTFNKMRGKNERRR